MLKCEAIVIPFRASSPQLRRNDTLTQQQPQPALAYNQQKPSYYSLLENNAKLCLLHIIPVVVGSPEVCA